ncbi:hypothetical protein DYB32_005953 [Aphanomyces invadans]|nr:hypothetical protein DYB32_005953 [Aphanomyces invadans]
MKARTWVMTHKRTAALVAALAVVGTILGAITVEHTLFTSKASQSATAISGVCYDSYNAADMEKHFGMIKQKFNAVRTYQTKLGNKNMAAAAGQVGLKIAAGAWLRNGNDWKADVQAAIDAHKQHGNVLAIYVGNEDLMHGIGAGEIIYDIATAKGMVRAAGVNIQVGTVQTDGIFLANPDLANACDTIGVNIYPFFGASDDSWRTPVKDLTVRWNAIAAKYGHLNPRLTETGWPSGGGNNGPHVSNWDNAKSYFESYSDWARGSGGDASFYFMFHDNPSKGGFEANFGISDPNGVFKFNVAPAPAPPAPTPPPTAPPTPPPTAPPTTTPPPTEPPTTTPPPTTPVPTPEPTTSAPANNGTTTPEPTNSTSPESTAWNSTDVANGTLVDSSTTILMDSNTSSLDLPQAPNGGANGAPVPAGGSSDSASVNGVVLNSGEEDSAPTMSILLASVAAVGAAAVIALIVYNRRMAAMNDSKDDLERYDSSSRDFGSILQTGQSQIAIL